MTHIPPPEFGFCVIGTDTDVGKTVITAALLRIAADLSLNAQGIKLIQTGCLSSSGELLAPDLQAYQEAAPNIPVCALNTLRLAASPHLAAQNEAITLSSNVLMDQLSRQASQAALNIIEGAGGLMVPINKNETLLDVVAILQFPVILVVDNRLGAINHALLTLKTLEVKGIAVAGIIFNQTQPCNTAEEFRIIQDNEKTILNFSKLNVFASVPFSSELSSSSQDKRQQAWNIISNCLVHFMQTICNNIKNITINNPQNLEFDRKHLWHPYTSLLNPAPVHEVSKTSGNKIYLKNGNILIDGMSSWWSTVHGYNHPFILSAMHKQLEIMPHVMFGGLTHEPAINLAKILLEIVPSGLQHVFFADSGSVSVEVALKMAVQYQFGMGRSKRSRIIAHYSAYHGDTAGAMAVCDPINGMHTLFGQILPHQIFAPRPECRYDTPYNSKSFDTFRQLFLKHIDETAAVIIEPIVQGAGGMWFYHPDYLRSVSELCREHDILLVLDEIATGFGRTGKMFACEWAGIEPDIMCIGKALTGGAITLAATLASSKVALNLSNDGVLMHGPTFMANPLACAAAEASLILIRSEPIQEKVKSIEHHLRTSFESLRSLKQVQDVRILGAIGVVETKEPVDTIRLQNIAIKHSIWIRPFGKLIYIMPPYSLNEEECIQLTQGFAKTVQEYFYD